MIKDLSPFLSALYHSVLSSIEGAEVQLSSLADIVKGHQVNGELLSESGAYYMMNGGTVPSGYLDECNTQPNTISISEGGNSCGYVQWNEEAFWSGGHCYALRVKDSVSARYLYHYLKWKESDIMNLRIGSGLPNIQKKDLAKVMVLLPPTENQSEIAERLDTIDSKIQVEELLNAAYLKQKQHLLNKMFI